MDSVPAVVKALPVQIVPSSKHRVLAWSTAGMMERYVSYNPQIAKKLPPDVLAFALVHEYGHLQLNHVPSFGFFMDSADAIKQRELDADRFAARFWATNNTRVAQAAAAAFLSPGSYRALGSEKPERAAGYPTPKERAQAILACLAEAQQGMLFKSP